MKFRTALSSDERAQFQPRNFIASVFAEGGSKLAEKWRRVASIRGIHLIELLALKITPAERSAER